VDDDADSRDMLAIVLERSGAEVATAESAAEALASFQLHQPHVLLLDLGLPDEDGFSLLRKLRELGEEVPAIALTGYGSPEDRDQTRNGGFQAHLVKPVALSDMLDSVARVLQLPSRDALR
jgi:CheY-like chemotaxis protein